MLLKSEIDAEEAIGQNMATCIILNKEGITFRFQKYSMPLVEKMKKCFSQDDMNYLEKKIGDSLSGLLN